MKSIIYDLCNFGYRIRRLCIACKTVEEAARLYSFIDTQPMYTPSFDMIDQWHVYTENTVFFIGRGTYGNISYIGTSEYQDIILVDSHDLIFPTDNDFEEQIMQIDKDVDNACSSCISDVPNVLNFFYGDVSKK